MTGGGHRDEEERGGGEGRKEQEGRSQAGLRGGKQGSLAFALQPSIFQLSTLTQAAGQRTTFVALSLCSAMVLFVRCRAVWQVVTCVADAIRLLHDRYAVDAQSKEAERHARCTGTPAMSSWACHTRPACEIRPKPVHLPGSFLLFVWAVRSPR